MAYDPAPQTVTISIWWRELQEDQPMSRWSGVADYRHLKTGIQFTDRSGGNNFVPYNAAQLIKITKE